MVGASFSEIFWCRFRELKDQGSFFSFFELMKVIREEEEEEVFFENENIEELDEGDGYGYWDNEVDD